MNELLFKIDQQISQEEISHEVYSLIVVNTYLCPLYL